jgi:hypothetical protein
VRRALSLVVVPALALSLSACSALTQPEEITISAEPIAAAPAPAAAAPQGPGTLRPTARPAAAAKGG